MKSGFVARGAVVLLPVILLSSSAVAAVSGKPAMAQKAAVTESADQ